MNKKLLLIFSLLLCLFTGCGNNDTDVPDWYWKDKGTENTDDSIVGKPRYIWIDASGNFEQYANSQENIKSDLKKIKETGFTDVIVDVRPTLGDVLFKTSVADELKEIDVWTNNGYEWLKRSASWDYLQTFIDEGHRLGLRVNASVNTFVGGYLCPYGLKPGGMLFRDSNKKKWAEVLNRKEGLVNTMDLLDSSYDKGDWGTKFLNPANDEVQEYILNMLGDLAKYNLDGIILDRCRYGDNELEGDFSDESRSKFEEFIGKKVENWPSDVLIPGTKDVVEKETLLCKKWYAFRAKVIHDFVVKAKNKVKSVNNKIRFGTYVGAWYSTYYLSGVNWASPKYDPMSNTAYSKWTSDEYKNNGYADHLDFIFLGAYASTDAIYGSGEWTMQGFCKQGGELLKDDVPYYGGPDIGNGVGWTNGGQEDKISDAIDVCISNSDGFFAFDICHLRKFNYWMAFKNGFDNYLKSVKK